jgi:hypothetical protein
MPRTHGAIDKRPRKRSTGSRPKNKPAAQIAAGLPAGDPPAAAPSPEFFQQIEAAMGGPEKQRTLDEPGSQAPAAVTDGCGPAPVSPAQEEPPLTKEAWEGLLKMPFRLVGKIMRSPGIGIVGIKRAKDLARPSYPIFEHYAREYMALDPGNGLSLAYVATMLVLIDVGGDACVAYLQDRADQRPVNLPTVPGGEAVQSQAA